MNPLVNPDGPLLGVNIDHVATLRNARGGSFPDPVQLAHEAVQGGADIVTFHLREDRRHIHDADVDRLKQSIGVPLNFESAVTDEMLEIIERVRPEMVCLVPERRQEITTEGGLDVAGQAERVADACSRLARAGCRVSLFIEPGARQIEASARTGAPCVELHTGAWANAVDRGDTVRADMEGVRLREALALAHRLGLQTNAGHGLGLGSTGPVAAMGGVLELHIGHAIVGHALSVGMTQAVRDFKACIRRAIASSSGRPA